MGITFVIVRLIIIIAIQDEQEYNGSIVDCDRSLRSDLRIDPMRVQLDSFQRLVYALNCKVQVVECSKVHD